MHGKLYRLLFLLAASALILPLVACGGGEAVAPAVGEALPVEDSALADEVDVHTVATIKDQEDVYRRPGAVGV